jgi:hypothetical protein
LLLFILKISGLDLLLFIASVFNFRLLAFFVILFNFFACIFYLFLLIWLRSCFHFLIFTLYFIKLLDLTIKANCFFYLVLAFLTLSLLMQLLRILTIIILIRFIRFCFFHNFSYLGFNFGLQKFIWIILRHGSFLFIVHWYGVMALQT